MFATKIALATAAVATAAGATVYTVSRSDSSTTTTVAASARTAASPSTLENAPGSKPHSIVHRSASIEAHQKLAARIAAARQRRSGALPTLGPTELAHIKEYLATAFVDLKPLIAECTEHLDVGASIRVRCNVATEPDVGAVISSSEIVEDGTTIDDPDILDCVRETIASVELDPAEVAGEFAFETVVEMRSEEEKSED